MSKVDVKVVLLGKHSVGKTCLVERFLHGQFREGTVTTVGAAFGAKKLDVKGKEVTLGIWDTAGQERYESMSRIYYRSARAAIICYDLTDRKTFEKVQFWVDELLANEEGCEIYIVGTKLDLIQSGKIERAVRAEDVQEYARKIGAKVFDSSAKQGINVDEVFYAIAAAYVQSTAPSLPTASNTGKGGARVNTVRPGAYENPNARADAQNSGCC